MKQPLHQVSLINRLSCYNSVCPAYECPRLFRGCYGRFLSKIYRHVMVGLFFLSVRPVPDSGGWAYLRVACLQPNVF
jgi:hypothetical protein